MFKFLSTKSCYAYSLESHQDSSNEYAQHRVWKRYNSCRIPSLPLIWRSEMMLFVSELWKGRNIVRKEEKACYENFLNFPHYSI